MTARNNAREKAAPLTPVCIINEEREIENTNIPTLRTSRGRRRSRKLWAVLGQENALHKAGNPGNVHPSPQISNTLALESCVFKALLTGGWCQRQRFITFNDVRVKLNISELRAVGRYYTP